MYKKPLIKSTTVHDLKNSQQSRNKKELPEPDKGYKNILLVKERIFMPTIMNKASQSVHFYHFCSSLHWNFSKAIQNKTIKDIQNGEDEIRNDVSYLFL